MSALRWLGSAFVIGVAIWIFAGQILPVDQRLREHALVDDPWRVALLLSLGADPDAREAGEQTPLMLAAFSGSEASIESLLEAGADASLRDAKGRTASDIACAEGHASALALLAGVVQPEDPACLERISTTRDASTASPTETRPRYDTGADCTRTFYRYDPNNEPVRFDVTRTAASCRGREVDVWLFQARTDPDERVDLPPMVESEGAVQVLTGRGLVPVESGAYLVEEGATLRRIASVDELLPATDEALERFVSRHLLASTDGD